MALLYLPVATQIPGSLLLRLRCAWQTTWNRLSQRATELFEAGSEIVTYRDIDDFVAKARHFLERDAERATIAAADRARATRDHIRLTRFRRLFALIEAQRQNDAAATENIA